MNPVFQDALVAAQYFFELAILTCFCIVILLLVPKSGEGCLKSIGKIVLSLVIVCLEFYYVWVIMAKKYGPWWYG